MSEFHRRLSEHLFVKGWDVPESRIMALVLPAMGSPTRLYLGLCREFARAGIGAGVMNFRGEGLLKRPRLIAEGNFGYAELLEDIGSAVDALADMHPTRSILLVGHSLGGQLGSLFTCHGHPQVIGTVVVAGGNVGYRSWTGPDRYKTFFATQFFGLLSRILGWFPGQQIGFGGNQPRQVMADWSRNARTGRYRLANQRMDYERMSKRVESAFLGIVIDGDFFTPVESTQALLDKFSASAREIVTLTREKFHTPTPNHFSWLREPEPVVRTIESWLN